MLRLGRTQRRLSGDWMKTHGLLWIVPAVMSLIALAPLPYWYYMLLRVIVCAACSYLAAAEADVGHKSGWFYGLIAAALLFNPFVPVHLTRELWAVLNIGLAALLMLHLVVTKRRSVGQQKP